MRNTWRLQIKWIWAKIVQSASRIFVTYPILCFKVNGQVHDENLIQMPEYSIFADNFTFIRISWVTVYNWQYCKVQKPFQNGRYPWRNYWRLTMITSPCNMELLQSLKQLKRSTFWRARKRASADDLDPGKPMIHCYRFCLMLRLKISIFWYWVFYFEIENLRVVMDDHLLKVLFDA